MKKVLLVLAILGVSVKAEAAYLFRNSASNINSGILDPLRVNPATFTLLGSGPFGGSIFSPGTTLMSIYDEGTPQGNINTLNVTGSAGIISVIGSTGTLTLTGGGGGGTVQNSTKTFDITIAGEPILSTTTLFGLNGTTRSPGQSTWTITDLWATCAQGSTVGVIGIDLVYSSTSWSGSVSKLFDRMDVATITKSGDSAISVQRSTISFIGANTWLGVQISIMPQSGQNARDCHVQGYYWEANKYSP